MFFDIDVKYVADEVNNSPELRKYWGFKYMLNYNILSKLLSKFDSNQLLESVLKFINKQFIPGKRGRRTIILMQHQLYLILTYIKNIILMKN